MSVSKDYSLQGKMTTGIYTGKVFHQRHSIPRHQFLYSVFYFLIDLDEKRSINHNSLIFKRNGPAWFSFYDRRHGAGEESLKAWAEDFLEHKGIKNGPFSFQILAMPRILGYVFNPISVIYCYDKIDFLVAIIYEVNNTFGERIHYLCPVLDNSTPIQQSCEKALFVSPFFSMSGHYQFQIDRPSEELRLKIDYFKDNTKVLTATFSGKYRSFTIRNLLKLIAQYPALTWKVTLGIHFEALRIWAKGIPLVKHVKTTTKLFSRKNNAPEK
jgi:DUF1365 family protein